MSQDEHPQKCARARHKARTKEGSNNAHGRHCANRAPLRRPGATHKKGSKTKSPFCVVLKTYHLTGNHHETCLKNSNFLNRKLCVSNCYPHGTPWQQQGDREPKEKQKTPQQVETRFKTRQLQHLMIYSFSPLCMICPGRGRHLNGPGHFIRRLYLHFIV